MLGSQAFIDYVKDNFVSGMKANRDLPSIRKLSRKITIQDVSDIVGQEFIGKSRLSKNVKIYLCRKLTGDKLKIIGSHFGISDAAVSH